MLSLVMRMFQCAPEGSNIFHYLLVWGNYGGLLNEINLILILYMREEFFNQRDNMFLFLKDWSDHVTVCLTTFLNSVSNDRAKGPFHGIQVPSPPCLLLFLFKNPALPSHWVACGVLSTEEHLMPLFTLHLYLVSWPNIHSSFKAQLTWLSGTGGSSYLCSRTSSIRSHFILMWPLVSVSHTAVWALKRRDCVFFICAIPGHTVRAQ